MVSSIPPCSLLLPWAFIATEAFSGQFCQLEEHFVSFETIKDSSHTTMELKIDSFERVGVVSERASFSLA